MGVVEDDQGVGQRAVDEVGAQSNRSEIVEPTSLGALATPETLSTLMREVSMPLRGSLAVSEEKSRPSTSRVLGSARSSEIVALSGRPTA